MDDIQVKTAVEHESQMKVCFGTLKGSLIEVEFTFFAQMRLHLFDPDVVQYLE